jgi:hypothetical protein
MAELLEIASPLVRAKALTLEWANPGRQEWTLPVSFAERARSHRKALPAPQTQLGTGFFSSIRLVVFPYQFRLRSYL